jgi:hypothetical protein
VWCVPGAGKKDGGARDWIVTGKMVFDNAYGRDVTVPFANDHVHPRHVWCPNRSVRRDRRIAAWNALAGSSASSRLRQALGPVPYRPAGVQVGWEAHHTVPEGSPNATAERELLFRCRIHPNQKENGVYLRAADLRRDTAAWQSLNQTHPALAMRTYHADTFGKSYYQRLDDDFAPVLHQGETCTPAMRTSTLSILGAIDSALEHGTYGVEQGR